tara:strand:+ start:3719 stop:4816 length:1098 start_codon:yes stop_codon:yes gene_type:complete
MGDYYIFNLKRYQKKISLFVKIFLIASMIYAAYYNLWHILVADTLLLILLFLPYFLKRLEVKLPYEFELVVLFFVIVTFFLGDIKGFIIQLFFGLALGFFGFATLLILYSNSKLKTDYFFIILFAISFSVAVGLCVEMAKFYLKIYLGYEFGVYEYHYTMRSLSTLFAGAVIASFVGYFYMNDYRPMFLVKIVRKFKKKNPNLFVKQIDSPVELISLIKRGENDNLEFKETLRKNVHTGEIDKRIERSVLKTIVAFLNSAGGTLLIGVNDYGEIKGIERDGFESKDKFNLHFANLLRTYVGKEFFRFLNSELVLVEGKSVLKVECLKSNKPVFFRGGQEEFYIRTGPATIQITGKEFLDYVKENF